MHLDMPLEAHRQEDRGINAVSLKRIYGIIAPDRWYNLFRITHKPLNDCIVQDL